MQRPKVRNQGGHQIQWAAQFAVASELCKRGYEVSFAMGNTAPVADLMVVSPVKREMFLIEVKGMHRPNPWIMKRKAPRAMLFYVLAYVPANASNEFFVLRQQDTDALIAAELKRLNRPENYPVTGFGWKAALIFRNAWNVLPA
jgi:hypothetical protein